MNDMSDLTPEYTFEDGLVTASVNGKVIASGSTLDEVEQEVAEALQAPVEKVDKSRKATHVVSPNGLKGQILSRVAHIWGDEVTVRFENGQIHSMAVTDRTNFTTENVKTASSSPLQRLASTLEKTITPDRESLQARFAELEDAKTECRQLIASGASDSDSATLHRLALEAEQEQQEIREHVDHLDATEGEGIQPFRPTHEVVEQADVGHNGTGTWLDATLREMEEETAQTDYEAFLDDGPTLFVAEQDEATLADAGDVRERALSHVQAKTAGVQSDKLDQYEKLFLARVEEARRVELASRKHTARKEATKKKSNVDDAPVESLFF
jgi:hypothetical protein